jgi:phosphoesterase RecJ-like protein
MKELVQALRKADHVLVATHLNPDGDGLGSALALALALESMGTDARVYARDGVPPVYQFLPQSHRVLTTLEGVNPATTMLVLIDCNMPERAGLQDAGRFAGTLVIDHHATESDFGDVRWVDPESPAAGLMIHQLLGELGISLTPAIATNLYAALAVDTGTFRYPNTTTATFRAAAELMEAGARPDEVSRQLYQSWSRNRFELLYRTLSTSEIRGPVASIMIPESLFRETGTTSTDTEHFVNYPLMVKDVLVSVLLRQTGADAWKVSLRSKGDINVAMVAEGFGGGGHRNAAGCTVTGDADTARAQVLAALRAIPMLG